MITIELPPPPPELSPNARCGWRAKAAAVQQYRYDCKIEAMKQVLNRGEWMMRVMRQAKPYPVVEATITFILKDKRRHDWDNLLASFKAGIDGLVDAGLLPDDDVRSWTPTLRFEQGEEPDKGGVSMNREPYWLIPPEVYDPLNQEYGFDFDPCPCPKPENYNGLVVPWGRMNWVNPPFHKEEGVGPTAFVRKAIAEARKGNASYLTLPTQSYVNLLLEAGAIPESLGRIRWLHIETGEPSPAPSPITGFYLPGNRTAPVSRYQPRLI